MPESLFSCPEGTGETIRMMFLVRVCKNDDKQNRIDAIGDAIIALPEERQDIMTAAAKYSELVEWLEDLTGFLNK